MCVQCFVPAAVNDKQKHLKLSEFIVGTLFFFIPYIVQWENFQPPTKEFFYWKGFGAKIVISGWLCPQVLRGLVVSALQIGKVAADGSSFYEYC